MPVEAVTSAAPALERPLAVLLPLPLDGAFDYRAPQGLCAPPGTFVRVPFGRREALGVGWDDSERPRASPPAGPAGPGPRRRVCPPPGRCGRVPLGRREALGVVWDDSERPRDS